MSEIDYQKVYYKKKLLDMFNKYNKEKFDILKFTGGIGVEEILKSTGTFEDWCKQCEDEK